MSLNFILDTNVIADIANLTPNLNVLAKMRANQSNFLYLSAPVDYEVRRGYIKKNAVKQLATYENGFKPLFEWADLEATDWQRAAQLWADAQKIGKQLSDIDLLIAAIAIRLNAIVVTE